MGPLKKLQKNPRHQKAFQQPGKEWVVTDDLHLNLEAFTYMYRYPRFSSLIEVRTQMLQKMVGEDKKANK